MSSAHQLGFLAMSIFLGIAFPVLAALCKPLLLPMVFLLFTAAILQVSFGDAAVQAFRSKNCWVILAWQLLALPLIGAVLLAPLLNSELYIFAVVSLCTCTITATTALSRLLGLNDALAMVVGLIGSLLMPIPLYCFMRFVLDLPAMIDGPVYLWRVFVFLILPFLLVTIFRRLVSTGTEQWARENVASFVIVLLVIFGLAVMDGVQVLLLENPALIFSYVLLSFGLSLIVQLLTWFALRRIGATNAMTAALLCAYRNLGVIAAIAGTSLGDNFLIFVGIWQVPMYTLPHLLRRYYRLGATAAD